MKVVLPISIVIPTMNRPNALRRTIENLMNKNHIPNQIVIIDQSTSNEDQQGNQKN